ncbi:MAG: hypothetical protein LAP39_14465 [Acidobacteriia bacterium]|nr:hypothetical protein [Terriglobia bacterium]
MRSLLIRSLAGGSLLLMALGAYAQDYPRYRDDDRYSARGGRGYYGRPGNRGSLMDQVQADLRFAQGAAYSRGEAKRLDKAREELWEFQRKWNAGRFDHHELDDSIAAIQKVIDHNGLDERTRSMLWSDLRQLRDFRAQQP